MIRKMSIFFIASITTLQNCWANAVYFYRIKKDENVTKVLYITHLKPIYTSNGTLRTIQKTNSQNIFDLNKLMPGDKLYFDEKLVQIALNKKTIRIENQNEIIITDQAYLSYEQNKVNKNINKRVVANTDYQIIQESKPEIIDSHVSPKSETVNTNPAAQQYHVNHSFGMLGFLNYTTLSSRDGQNNKEATLLTDRDIELDFSFKQSWTNTFSTAFGLSFRHIVFLQNNTGNKSLSSTEQNLSGMSLGINYKLSDTIHLEPTYELFQKLFIRGVTTTLVSLDKVMISALGLKFNIRLFEKDDSRINIAIGAKSLFKAQTETIDVNSGYSLDADLNIIKKYKQSNYQIGFGMSSHFQNTSVTTQSETVPHVSLGIQSDMFLAD